MATSCLPRLPTASRSPSRSSCWMPGRSSSAGNSRVPVTADDDDLTERSRRKNWRHACECCTTTRRRAIVRLMWQTEVIPPALVRGTFVMLYKKGPRNNFGNCRAIGLMCHSYKLLSLNKSKYMIFHVPNKDIQYLTLKIDNVIIEKVDEFSFLGLTLDTNLNWKRHSEKNL